jgi:hypothetical protein
MKRTWQKVSFAFLTWITLILFVMKGSPSDQNIKSSDFHDLRINKRTFDQMTSVWPRIAGREVSSLIDFNRADFNPWLDLDDECSKFKTHFAKPGVFLPPVYFSSYPGLPQQMWFFAKQMWFLIR